LRTAKGNRREALVKRNRALRAAILMVASRINAEIGNQGESDIQLGEALMAALGMDGLG
jgi:hypothetical protein